MLTRYDFIMFRISQKYVLLSFCFRTFLFVCYLSLSLVFVLNFESYATYKISKFPLRIFIRFHCLFHFFLGMKKILKLQHYVYFKYKKKAKNKYKYLYYMKDEEKEEKKKKKENKE